MRICFILWASLLLPVLQAQTDWPGYGHDEGAQRYSPLTQINTSNVSGLIPAWTFDMKKDGVPFRPSQSTPLVVNGVMYLSWPFNHVAALEPTTGKMLWEFTAKSGFSGKLGSMRSVAYSPGDRRLGPEILFATEEGELWALNAKTGRPVPGFGNDGIVNLKTPEIMNGFPNLHLGISSVPFVYKNLVITGSHLVDETGAKGPAGDVRAWDLRSGHLVWTFHSVPRPGEKGHKTWHGDQWKDRTGVNVWTFFTADVKRGILYMPFGSANNDYYGVDRQGANLFANSLVAVDAETGKLKWYFQAIHHDLWDYDLPVPPILFDVEQEGRTIPAVGAMTKMGMLFILNRTTGKPIYGVEERPAPKGDLPDEYYAPTQPFPVKPPPLSRLSFTIDDIAKITPEHERPAASYSRSTAAAEIEAHSHQRRQREHSYCPPPEAEPVGVVEHLMHTLATTSSTRQIRREYGQSRSKIRICKRRQSLPGSMDGRKQAVQTPWCTAGRVGAHHGAD